MCNKIISCYYYEFLQVLLILYHKIQILLSQKKQYFFPQILRIELLQNNIVNHLF